MAGLGVRELIDSHYESLYRYACRLSGSSVDAEDLTQETFRKAITRLPQLREESKARAWLYRILRNAYLHRVRDEKRKRLVPLDNAGELANRNGDVPDLPDIDPAKVQAALDDLDESFRTPLILYYFEDFSYRDIAEQMDLPIGTVMSRLARAKSHLRGKLASGSGS